MTSKPDFKVMILLLLVFMQLTRDLFAIAKFLFYCVVDHRAQKAYLSNLSTFRKFACHNHCAQTLCISSDGIFAHHLFACTKVLSQTAKDEKGSIAQQCCNTGLFVACTNVLSQTTQNTKSLIAKLV